MGKEIKETEAPKETKEQPPVSAPNNKKKEETVIKAAEAWAAELRTPSWQLAALKQHMAIADGKALTRSEFEAGITAAINKRK